jgi:hypothetical protein
MTVQTCCGLKNEDRFFLAKTVGLGESNILGTPTSSINSTASTSSTTEYSSFSATSTILSQLLVTTVVTSVSSSETHPSATSTLATSPSPSNQQSLAKTRAVSMGVGFGVGFTSFVLVSLLTYYIISRRKQKLNRKSAQASVSNGAVPEVYYPEDSVRPELGSYEIRMIDNRDEMLYGALAKAELHGRGIERFEVEGQS